MDRGARAAKTVKRPRQQSAHPPYANYWAPLTRKQHPMPHPAQPRHTNYWAPRTRKRHQQEHRPQRPTEHSHPTQHAKGRTGDCPGPRKGATTRRNVTQGGGVCGLWVPPRWLSKPLPSSAKEEWHCIAFKRAACFGVTRASRRLCDLNLRMSAAAQSAQLECQGCHLLLAFPLGAQSVRCPICDEVTPTGQIRVKCTTCASHMLLPSRTTLALCPCCGSVMRLRGPEKRPRQPTAAPKTSKKCVVYVENPPTKAPDGRLVENMSIATKVDLFETHPECCAPASSSTSPRSCSSSAISGSDGDTAANDKLVAIALSMGFKRQVVERLMKNRVVSDLNSLLDLLALSAQLPLPTTESHEYYKIRVTTDRMLRRHSNEQLVGSLLNCDCADGEFYVRRDDTWGAFQSLLHDKFEIAPEHQRLWKWTRRNTRTYRPDTPIHPTSPQNDATPLREVLSAAAPGEAVDLFLEMPFDDSDAAPGPRPPDADDALLLFKSYDPPTATLRYIGSATVPLSSPASALLPLLNRRLGRTADLPLLVFEEVTPACLDRLELDSSLRDLGLGRGDIVVCQPPVPEAAKYEFPSARDAFAYWRRRVAVEFAPLTAPQDVSCTLELMRDDDVGSVRAKLHAALQRRPGPPLQYPVTSLRLAGSRSKGLFPPGGHCRLKDMLAIPGQRGRSSKKVLYCFVDPHDMRLEHWL